MNSGVIGGILGAKLEKYLIKRFGRRSVKFFNAFFGLVLSTIILLGYFYYFDSYVMDDIYSAEATYNSVEQAGLSSDSGTIILKTNEFGDIRIIHEMWSGRLSTSAFKKALNNSSTISVWIDKKTRSILFGFQIPAISVPPEFGLRWENKNRKWVLYLSIFFYVLSGIELILAFRSKP